MPAESATHRVLVVDDDRMFADSLAAVLSEKGFDASVVYSGPQAIEAALKSPPEFIVMDVMMEGIDGVDAAIAISETAINCRILLISGALEALERLAKGTRRGHHFDLLMKPVEAASLLERLRRPLAA